jgi:hypothetical protein
VHVATGDAPELPVATYTSLLQTGSWKGAVTFWKWAWPLMLRINDAGSPDAGRRWRSYTRSMLPWEPGLWPA